MVCPLFLVAQNGTISGVVTDATNKQPLAFANVVVMGESIGGTTDLDGGYSFSLKEGTYTIIISFVGYVNDTLLNVKVTPDKTTTLHVVLAEASNIMDGVDVTARRKTDTKTAINAEIKQSQQIVSGISAQQIKQSQDRDASDVVKRIPGVTIMNSRFVLIRGLSERYNTVMLNDILTPSTEPEKKAFSFDAVSSGALDRILIYKTGAPELPGEFAGGVIKIFTRNFSDENITSISYSASYRDGTTFKPFYSSERSSTDFLGFDDGLRALPDNFAQNLNAIQSKTVLETEGKKLNNLWQTYEKMASPDHRFSFTLNRNFKPGKATIGMLTSISYSNTNQTYVARNQSYQNFIDTLQASEAIYDYNDINYINKVRVGALHSWSIMPNPRNKFEFRNFFNQLGIDQTTFRSGIHQFESREDRNYAYRYQSRTIYMGQLSGQHDFTEQTKLNWTGAYSLANGNQPDFRKVRYRRQLGTDEPFRVIIPPGAQVFDAGRFYSTVKENAITGKADFEHTFKSEKENPPVIKAGVYVENKQRDFSARWMSYKKAVSSSFDQNLLLLPVNEVFAPENVNSSTGFELAEGTNTSDKYEASNQLFASYLSGSYRFFGHLNVSGGARVEYNIQQLSSQSNLQAIEVDNPILSVLPSLNIGYHFTEKHILRAAYYKTVNRPEFRELAPFTFYDFTFNNTIAGNPNLQTPTIDNLDLRFEIYPTRGEVIHIATYYKRFTNPIETVFEAAGGAGTNSFRFANAVLAYSVGAELEVRKSLSSWFETGFLQYFGVQLNTSYIYSQVDFGGTAPGQSDKRPLMGQSPYIINAGLFFENQERQIQANLQYNIVGKRLFAVGSQFNPDIYEMPRNVLDLTVSKGIGKRLEVKLGIQDILNQRVWLIQDSNRDGKIDSIDEDIMSYKQGTYFTLGINLKLNKLE